MRQLANQSRLNLSTQISFLALFSLNLLINSALAAETPAKTQLANPAALVCINNGRQLRIEKDSAGNQTGWCYWQSGEKCEEWAYFRGECKTKKPQKTDKH